MQLLVTFEPKQKFERGDEQPSGHSVYLPGTESEMACREEPRRLVSGLVGSCSSLNKNRRTTSRSSPSKSLLYVAWLAPHLPWQGASDRERHRWSDSHPLKVVTADDVLVESANRSMQVPLNSNSDPSAWDWRLLARLALHGEPPRLNLLKAFPIRARQLLQLNVDALPGSL